MFCRSVFWPLSRLDLFCPSVLFTFPRWRKSGGSYLCLSEMPRPTLRCRVCLYCQTEVWPLISRELRAFSEDGGRKPTTRMTTRSYAGLDHDHVARLNFGTQHQARQLRRRRRLRLYPLFRLFHSLSCSISLSLPFLLSPYFLSFSLSFFV